MKIPVPSLLLLVPLLATAGVGRGEAERKNQACDEARTKAEATCASGHAVSLGACECVERKTTLYLRNWRCAVRATCDAEKAATPAVPGREALR
jgi:hypothetical protein